MCYCLDFFATYRWYFCRAPNDVKTCRCPAFGAGRHRSGVIVRSRSGNRRRIGITSSNHRPGIALGTKGFTRYSAVVRVRTLSLPVADLCRWNLWSAGHDVGFFPLQKEHFQSPQMLRLGCDSAPKSCSSPRSPSSTFLLGITGSLPSLGGATILDQSASPRPLLCHPPYHRIANITPHLLQRSQCPCARAFLTTPPTPLPLHLPAKLTV